MNPHSKAVALYQDVPIAAWNDEPLRPGLLTALREQATEMAESAGFRLTGLPVEGVMTYFRLVGEGDKAVPVACERSKAEFAKLRFIQNVVPQ